MSNNYDRLLHTSPFINVGQFDCPANSPDFNNTGPIGGYLLAFPRTAVKIRHSGSKDDIVADSNVVTIYNKGQEYERFALSRYGDHCDWVSLCPAIVCEILHDIGVTIYEQPERVFDISHGITSDQTYIRLRQLVNKLSLEKVGARNRGIDKVGVEEEILCIIREVLINAYQVKSLNKKSQRQSTAQKHLTLSRRAAEMLAAYFQEDLSLEKVSNSLNVSPYHLSRVFSRTYGLSLHQYLIQLRLRNAMQCIAETNIDLSELGLSLGFSDHSHFSASFKKKFGLSPSSFRHSAGFIHADIKA